MKQSINFEDNVWCELILAYEEYKTMHLDRYISLSWFVSKIAKRGLKTLETEVMKLDE